ncbi:MAG TPA: SGNH/GDSL hydrolase family protein [Lacipirellulaceae bacterium]|nr:SGNH/GDSL hydrolase family protein [Lacipirellulaceae bacterium]
MAIPHYASTRCDERTKKQIASRSPHDLAYIVDLLRQPYPHNRTVNIVCHGHSVPAGYFETPVVQSFDSYPHLLHAALKQRFPFAIINVIVTAIGGEDSEQGAARFEQDVLPHRPHLVTIDYSLNDRRIGLDRAEQAWRAMIERAVVEDIPVILVTPSADLDVDFADAENPLLQHAAQVRKLARQYGAGLADTTAAFQKFCRSGERLQELMAHNRHPNRAGHQLIADALLSCLVGEGCSDNLG